MGHLGRLDQRRGHTFCPREMPFSLLFVQLVAKRNSYGYLQVYLRLMASKRLIIPDKIAQGGL